jgi:hypothetical protein
MTCINTSLVASADATGTTALTNQMLAKAIITNDAETDTVRYSLNVSSITDNGVGIHYANYTNQYSTRLSGATTSGRYGEGFTSGYGWLSYDTKLSLIGRTNTPSIALVDTIVNGFSFGDLA